MLEEDRGSRTPGGELPVSVARVSNSRMCRVVNLI